MSMKIGPIYYEVSAPVEWQGRRVATLFAMKPRAVDVHAHPWKLVAMAREPAMATLEAQNRTFPSLKAARAAVQAALQPARPEPEYDVDAETPVEAARLDTGAPR